MMLHLWWLMISHFFSSQNVVLGFLNFMCDVIIHEL